jgi:alpha-L-fucosidase
MQSALAAAPAAALASRFSARRLLAQRGPDARRAALQAQVHIAPGPFKPTWESLVACTTPDWFRDAKFGIWNHWSAQCVPRAG